MAAPANSQVASPGLRELLRAGLGVPVGLLAVLAMIVLPLPPLALDVLFTFNIALSMVIVMAVFYVARPIEFGVFPTVLLLATLARHFDVEVLPKPPPTPEPSVTLRPKHGLRVRLTRRTATASRYRASDRER